MQKALHTGLRVLVFSALALVLSASAAFAASGGRSSSRLIERMDGPQLLEIMKDAGYSAKLDEDEDIRWRLNSQNCLILFYNDGEAIQFYYGVRGVKVSLETVNEWNTGKRFSRGYLDRDNDPCLELDLDLAGGVSRARIEDWLRTCELSFRQWRSEVLGK